ncbi:FadR/GntR family transcriptional regulator [Phaeacidiphilus oryzae]|jgi:DNA-binding FadR family transcriptional regulator|uniref:FadR/GntR family transcriptional regulator n=1 Tax=Phaeacidiphilus oryzae TaxID=348818 RepID=UPI00056C7371|nr:FadR/GntR family transcriptional regulator [Phaeacidiphilus oryzae]
MPLQSTPRTNLVGQVIEQLQRLVENGEWPVGTKIPAEPQLVEELGVGRNTVREAVRALVHTGLLEPRQGDGTYVRASSDFAAAMQRRLRRAGALDAYEVRASLERDAARHAAERRTPADVAALRAALTDRQRAWADGDMDALVDADVRFHRAVVAATRNPVLAELYEHFSEALWSTLRLVVAAPLPDDMRLQADQHAAMADAIEAGDAEAAERIALAHLAESREAVRQFQEQDRAHPGEDG